MSKSVISNKIIGLDGSEPGKPAGEINLPISLMKFVHGQKEAPVPKATVGKAQTVREHILVASLFPNIYTRHK